MKKKKMSMGTETTLQKLEMVPNIHLRHIEKQIRVKLTIEAVFFFFEQMKFQQSVFVFVYFPHIRKQNQLQSTYFF